MDLPKIDFSNLFLYGGSFSGWVLLGRFVYEIYRDEVRTGNLKVEVDRCECISDEQKLTVLKVDLCLVGVSKDIYIKTVKFIYPSIESSSSNSLIIRNGYSKDFTFQGLAELFTEQYKKWGSNREGVHVFIYRYANPSENNNYTRVKLENLKDLKIEKNTRKSVSLVVSGDFIMNDSMKIKLEIDYGVKKKVISLNPTIINPWSEENA
ncbi:hypothetical protein V0288_23140 [Pannus brasiliensis CCIBt3594]|uniref:Uncharacterized protein n=1 Tax=Pannus brasiliensis CCIBt3594 TaxID=1427578 RepID=A0AAW9R0L6_9CHRO